MAFDMNAFAVNPDWETGGGTSFAALPPGVAQSIASEIDALRAQPPPAAASELAVTNLAPPAAPLAPQASPATPQAPPTAQPTLTATPPPATPANWADFDTLSRLTVGTPDFGAYSGSAGDYRPAQLMAADPSRGFSTPYYAAYTNDDDFAGAVMAAPGQKIRLVDGKTGQVVFEGTGPEAAQQATSIANAVSQDRGRKASWAIQTDFGDQGWQTMAAERYDPKKRGILGTVMDIAAPFVLNALLPGLGGALGGALGGFGGRVAFQGLANLGSGLLQGENLTQAATGALTSGLTSGALGSVAGRVPGLTDTIGRVTGPVQDVFNTALGPVRAVLDPVNNGLVNLIDGAGNVVSTFRGGLDDVRGMLSDTVNGALGRGPVVTPGSLPGNVNFVTTPADIGLGLDPYMVAPVTVTGGGFNALPGLPGGFQPVTGNEIEGIDVVGGNRDFEVPVPTPTGVDLDGIATELDPITVSPSPPPQPGVPVAVPPPGPVDLVNTPSDINPDFSVTPTGTMPGIPSPVSVTGGGSGLISNAGTRASLSPVYTAPLPPPTFGARQPRDVLVDKRYAIERPEASFFTNVPERQTSGFAVPSPDEIMLAGIGDLDGDGAVTAADRELWRKRFSGRGYAEGGDVSHGRSDDIEALLSDGEYVIDAETVALLGNGSSKAGADMLDQFRVNVRKHKGRDLAKGRFSADARDPFDYLETR